MHFSIKLKTNVNILIHNSCLKSFETVKFIFSDFELYQFPFFTKEFCKNFIDEIQNFLSSDAPKVQPNTMNKYGVSETISHQFVIIGQIL